MKIAFIGKEIVPANVQGVERYVEEVSLCMAEKGHDVFIYSYDKKLTEIFKGLGNIKIISIPKFFKKFPFVEVLWATIDCVKSKYDVVHYQSKNTFFLSKIIEFFCRQTKIVSSFDLQCDFRPKPGIIFHENKEKNILSKWKLRKKRYMLFADSFQKISGAHFLIEAFKQLEDTAKTPNNFKLVILQIGGRDDDYVKYLKTIAESRDNIIILGKQSEKTNWQLFADAHIFVKTSYDEKSSNDQLTRAMLCGVAPFASNAKENVRMIGANGILFESKSVSDLRDKLAYFLSRSEEVEKIGKKAKEKIEKEFGWGKIAERTIKSESN